MNGMFNFGKESKNIVHCDNVETGLWAFTSLRLFLCSDMWDLQAYVTATEWGWMHENIVTSSMAEIDLERPQVYEMAVVSSNYTTEHLYALLTRGSLATLKTSKAKECIFDFVSRCSALFRCSIVALCMQRPLSIVQYCIRLFLESGISVDNVLYVMWTRAIYGDRRDVIAWMGLNYPQILVIALEHGRLASIYMIAVHCNRIKTVRWMCKKYGWKKELL